MNTRQRGFSLLELMIVLAIFLVVSGVVFQLLNAAQIRYRAEQEFLESFQGGRLAVDQITRDVHNAGYPPPITFPGNFGKPPTPAAYPAGTWTDPLLAPAGVQSRFAIGILGVTAGGAVSTTCTVNGGASPCALPNAWDMVLELDVDPENSVPTPQIEWVRYNLPARAAGAATSTLFRTVLTKVVGGNPTANASNVPFVENVVQNSSLGVSLTNPAVFTYVCDPKMIITGTTACLAEHVKDVFITLQVRSTRADIQTQQFRQITVRGMASRQYPSR